MHKILLIVTKVLFKSKIWNGIQIKLQVAIYAPLNSAAHNTCQISLFLCKVSQKKILSHSERSGWGNV